MAYTSTTGDTYHDRRRCRRLHNTGGRIRSTDDTDGLDACPNCADGDDGDDGDDPDTCEVVKSDGEVCGRELPCGYHD